MKPDKGSESGKIYDSSSFIYDDLKIILCFIHAFTGCDTTSCFYKRGKVIMLTTLSKNRPDLIPLIDECFNDPNAEKNGNSRTNCLDYFSFLQCP